MIPDTVVASVYARRIWFQSPAFIKYAEPIIYTNARLHGEPNDPKFAEGDQWHLTKISAPQAWDIAIGESNIVVAVIDRGTDTTHTDLHAALWKNAVEDTGQSGVDDDNNGFIDDLRGWNTASDNNNIIDTHGHGTAVAGIACEITNNSSYGAGVAGGWGTGGGARLMTLKMYGGVESVALMAALEYAADMNAEVINISQGDNSWDVLMVNEAVEYAIEAGVMIVCSAGNSPGPIYFPSSHDSTIAVGASTSNDLRKSDSAYGTGLHLVAPGVDIGTTGLTDEDGWNGTFNGTSAAAPQVSATVALILSVNPNLERWEVEEVLCRTADKAGGYSYTTSGAYGMWNNEMGYGRLNVFNAVAHAKIATMSSGDSLDLTGDVIVNEGDTFTIPSGTTLRFASGKKLIVKGALVANNVTFTRISTGWGGIETSTANASISLTNCTVERATTGVYCNYDSGTDRPTIQISGGTYQNNTTAIRFVRASSSSYVRGALIQDNDTGIRYEYCSAPIGTGGSWADSNRVCSNYEYGIRLLSSSSPYVGWNKIIDNDENESEVRASIWCESSDPTIAHNNIYGNGDYCEYNVRYYSSGGYADSNWCYGTQSAEIYITQYSDPNLNGRNCIHTSDYDDNNNPPGTAPWAIQFGSNQDDDAYAIDAGYNWWGTASPTWSNIISSGGYWSASALGSKPRTDWTKPARRMEESSPDGILAEQASDAERNGDYATALMRYRSLVTDYPASPLARRALRRLFVVMTHLGASQGDMEAYFVG